MSPTPLWPAFVPPQPGHDPAVDDAAHAGDLAQVGAVDDVARRGAHDRDELPGFDGPRGGGGDVRVDVPDGDRDPLGQAGPGGGSGGEGPGARTQLPERVVELVGHERLEARREFAEEVAAGVLAVLQDALVVGRAGVADVGAGQLPDDPVGRLDPVAHRRVDVRGLFEHLEALGELPLRRDQPAVARQPLLAARPGQLVDPVGLRLGGVVAPQLHVRVRLGRELRQLAQRRSVHCGRNHRAGGEVGGDADDVGGVRAGRGQGGGDGGAQDVDVVRGHLQRPLRRQRPPGRRELAVDDAVAVLRHGAAQLGTVPHAHDDRAPGERAVVDADDEGFC